MSTRILMEGPVYNTRDLGGILTTDGYVIREHRLIRSGMLNKCTPKDIQVLTEQFDLHTIIDLRTDAEIQELPDPHIEGVQTYHNPVMDGSMLGITREGLEKMGNFAEVMAYFSKGPTTETIKIMSRIYPTLVTEPFCLRQISKFFQLLLDQENGATLWHCTVGKDRVGTTTALLLTALGVDYATIMQDYLFTNECLQPETEAMIAQVMEQHPDPRAADVIRILNGADKSYLDAVFDEINRQSGNVENFLAEKIGLTDHKRDLLRKKYLV